MNENNILNFLGLARRAGKLSPGHDAAFDSVKRGRAKLILLANDASDRLVSEFEKSAKFDNRNIEVLKLGSTTSQIGEKLGRDTAVMTVNDEGFAEKLIQMIKGGIV